MILTPFNIPLGL